MQVCEIVNSFFSSKTYILPVGDSKECWLVDCGDVEKITAQGWVIRGVLLTHAHYDHIYGINKLLEVFPDALIYTNEEGKKGLLNPKLNFSRYHEDVDDFVINDPDSIVVIEEGPLSIDGRMDVEVVSTPGHDPSCLSYIIGNRLFTGDSLIPGIKVITTFPRSDKRNADDSLIRLTSLRENRDLEIFPGHKVKFQK